MATDFWERHETAEAKRADAETRRRWPGLNDTTGVCAFCGFVDDDVLLGVCAECAREE